MRRFVWMLALLLSITPLIPTEAEAGSELRSRVETAIPASLAGDTTWSQTARLQVPVSVLRAAVVLDSLIAVLNTGALEEAKKRPTDTTRQPLSALSVERLSQATHLVVGYRFKITEADGLQERLRTITVVADSTAECDRRYDALLHLDATREPVRSYLTETGATVPADESPQSYDSLTEVLQFVRLHEARADAPVHVLTIGGEKACQTRKNVEDLLEDEEFDDFWENVLISE